MRGVELSDEASNAEAPGARPPPRRSGRRLRLEDCERDGIVHLRGRDLVVAGGHGDTAGAREVARVGHPEEEVREVEFLVDGRRLWIDEEPPYSYGADGAYLGTTRFYGEPGTSLHFTVRARLDDGRTRKEFVLAEVPRPIKSNKRAPVWGIWGRTSPSYISNPPPPGELGPFTSNLNLHGHEFWVGRSIDRASMYELWADERRFHVGLPIFIGSTTTPGGEQGWTFDGVQCPPTGSEATYEWSWTKGRLVGHFQGEKQFARYLVLEADDEPCAARRRILEGVWEGVD
jgi:hypothetical protein